MARRWSFVSGVLLGAALAFPIGYLLAPTDVRTQLPVTAKAELPSDGSKGRNVFSPSIAGDPYVREQWRRTADMLERQCRERGLYCAEAKQARARIEGLD